MGQPSSEDLESQLASAPPFFFGVELATLNEINEVNKMSRGWHRASAQTCAAPDMRSTAPRQRSAATVH